MYDNENVTTPHRVNCGYHGLPYSLLVSDHLSQNY